MSGTYLARSDIDNTLNIKEISGIAALAHNLNR
jgi:hypothetical protein